MANTTEMTGKMFKKKNQTSSEERLSLGAVVENVFSPDSSGEGNGYPVQYCCLKNSMDRGAWSTWGCKESDTTEQLTLSFSL